MPANTLNKKRTKAAENALLNTSAITPPAQKNEGLPARWRWMKLGDVCKLKNGFAFKSTEYKSEGVPVIRISDINDGVVSIEDSIRVSPSEEYENYIVENDDILVAMSGATTGKFGIFKSKEKAYQNQRVGKFKILDYKILDNHFLFHQINSLKRQIEKDAYGGAQPNISSTKIEQMEILLPPLQDQHAIVSKIEELLSELDKGKQQLETAQQQLKIYRQAVLKWAFDLDNYKKYILKDVTSKIQIGPFGTQLHKEDYIENGVPLINPMHIQDGNIVPDYSYSISKLKLKSLPNYILKEGDVIMGRRGEMGRCGLVQKKEDGWLCGTGSLYFRPNTNFLDSKYLYFYLSSEPIKKYLNENAGGTTMANLNLKIVNDIPIHLPSTEKQKLIVEQIESRLSVCDKLEETINQSLAQAETLRQSILKRAFEGKLV